jgi:hypothetical protein
MDWDLILRLLKSLDENKVEYVLVGAVAMALRGLPRATQDIDLFIESSAGNVDKLKKALRAIWDDPEIENIQSGDLAGDFPVVRYGPPDGSLIVDAIARLGDAIRFEDLAWETMDLEGIPARVATPEQLYRMKRETVRLQDKVDASALKIRHNLKGD